MHCDHRKLANHHNHINKINSEHYFRPLSLFRKRKKCKRPLCISCTITLWPTIEVIHALVLVTRLWIKQTHYPDWKYWRQILLIKRIVRRQSRFYVGIKVIPMMQFTLSCMHGDACFQVWSCLASKLWIKRSAWHCSCLRLWIFQGCRLTGPFNRSWTSSRMTIWYCPIWTKGRD